MKKLQKNKNKTAAFCALACTVTVSLALFGCSVNPITEPGEAKGTYMTTNRLSAVEYSIYAGKQLQIFISALNARQLSMIASAGADSDTERTAAAFALGEMEEALNEFKQVYPAEGDEDIRSTAVTCMDAAIKHMQDYIETLDTGGDTGAYRDIFLNDIASLTTVSELYNS